MSTAANLSERREKLWMPVVAPIVWSSHFTVCYIVAALGCGRFGPTSGGGDAATLIAGLTAIAVAVIAACFVHGWRRHASRWPAASNDDDSPEDRHRFVAFTTMLLAGLSLLATLFVGVAALLVGPCP